MVDVVPVQHAIDPPADEHYLRRTSGLYPDPNGKPLKSIRLIVFYDALQDIRTFKLCESLYGKEFVINLLEEGIVPITFKHYPHNAEYMLSVREKINKAIIEKLQ